MNAQANTAKAKPKDPVNNNNKASMAPDLSGRFSRDYYESGNLTPDVVPAAEKDEIERENRLKCVLLGDGAVGKTSLIVSYSTNGYPTEYVPTAYDHYTVRVKIGQSPVRLQICDTAGQDEFDGMRPLCYPGTDVFLVCFSVVRPTSLCNVRDKWLPEIKKYNPKVPIVLVGTQIDLRNDLDILVDLARFSERPVDEREAADFAEQCGAAAYVECSALTQKNLKEVFDASLMEALEYKEKTERKSRKKRKRMRKNSSAFLNYPRKRKKRSVWWRKYLCLS